MDTNKKELRIGVIGAGPAGITAAYVLSKNNIQVDLYEASNSVGGMAKSINLWGTNVDIGPHRFFSADTRVNKLWLEVVKDDYLIVDRLTRMYYNDKFYSFPLKPLEVIKNLGQIELIKCFLSYVKCKIAPLKSDDLESWVINSFGKGLYSIFFKTYNEKLWGVSPKDLNKEFGQQRIKQIDLKQEILNFFRSQNKEFKTLADQFAYPKEGTGMVYERMKDAITKSGGNIYLNTRVKKLLVKDKKVYGLETEDGVEHRYDNVISSMPLTLLVRQLDDAPEEIINLSKQLTFRNTILVYLNIDQEDLFEDQWLYVHSPNLKTGRITNFNNFNQAKNGNSILAFEYWANDDDHLWSVSDEELIATAKEDAINSGLVKDAKILDGFVYKVPKCYPVYLKRYREHLDPVVDHLKGYENLMIIGRYGAFKYNNQDHSILMGLLAAENILKDAKHDLWDINNDYEYQEKSVISKTGLVKLEDDNSKKVFW